MQVNLHVQVSLGGTTWVCAGTGQYTGASGAWLETLPTGRSTNLPSAVPIVGATAVMYQHASQMCSTKAWLEATILVVTYCTALHRMAPSCSVVWHHTGNDIIPATSCIAVLQAVA